MLSATILNGALEIKQLRISLSKYRASGNTLRQYCSNITAIHSGNIVAILDFICKLVSRNIAVMILSGNIVAILPKLLQEDTRFAKTLCLSVRPSLYVYIYNIFFLSSKSNLFSYVIKSKSLIEFVEMYLPGCGCFCWTGSWLQVSTFSLPLSSTVSLLKTVVRNQIYIDLFITRCVITWFWI